MLRELHGDLIQLALKGEFDAIIHGCNCFCTMGAGIAKQIRMTFPEAYKADLTTTKGDKNKLGSYSSATSRGILILNAYTQFDYRGRGIKVDYDAVRDCLRKIARDYPTKRIGMPQIGAGLAGGDWPTIHSIISDELAYLNSAIVYYAAKT